MTQLTPGSPASTALAELLRRARYEVLPTATVADAVLAEIPPGRTLTITASPSRGLEPTMAVSESLAAAGYHVVPHLAARMISGRSELAEIVSRLLTAGVDSVFVPGGDAAPGPGHYESALELLTDLAELGNPFTHLGVTGYPESHPLISDDITIQAMWDKRRYATEVVSNLCFDTRALATWMSRIRNRGAGLPLWVGMAGPVDPAKLIAMAARIGVGESSRFLAKNKSFARVAAPGGYRPERFLNRLSPTLTNPANLVAGLHIYTFNQVAQTERWRTALLERLTRARRLSTVG